MSINKAAVFAAVMPILTGSALAKLPPAESLLNPNSQQVKILPPNIQTALGGLRPVAKPHFLELYKLDAEQGYDAFAKRIMVEITDAQKPFNPHFHAAAYAYLLVSQYDAPDPRRSAFTIYYEKRFAFEPQKQTHNLQQLSKTTANLTARFAFVWAALERDRASCVQDKNAENFYNHVKLPAFWGAIKPEAERLDAQTMAQASNFANAWLNAYKPSAWACVDGKQNLSYKPNEEKTNSIFKEFGLTRQP